MDLGETCENLWLAELISIGLGAPKECPQSSPATVPITLNFVRTESGISPVLSATSLSLMPTRRITRWMQNSRTAFANNHLTAYVKLESPESKSSVRLDRK